MSALKTIEAKYNAFMSKLITLIFDTNITLIYRCPKCKAICVEDKSLDNVVVIKCETCKTFHFERHIDLIGGFNDD